MGIRIKSNDKVLYISIFLVIFGVLISLNVSAAVPNPGHPANQIGDGIFCENDCDDTSKWFFPGYVGINSTIATTLQGRLHVVTDDPEYTGYFDGGFGVYINPDLEVAGSAIITGNLLIDGILYSTSNQINIGNSGLIQDLYVSGNIISDGTVTIGSTINNQDLQVYGDLIVGIDSQKQNVDINGNTDISDNLNVGGNTNIGGDLTVGGQTNLGTTNIDGALTVTGIINSPTIDALNLAIEILEAQVDELVNNYWQPDSNGIYYNQGNIGIGKTPSTNIELDVNGDIKANQICRSETECVEATYAVYK
ncbi:hypothetical protein ACFL1H_03290 [Nanoarchaeota archaeon]